MQTSEKQVYYSLKIGHQTFSVTGRKRTKAGYIMLCIHDHPNSDKAGYIFEHRIMVEIDRDTFLDKAFDVHHKNGIKHDNRIENLEVISHSDHTILHNLGKNRSLETRRKISRKTKERFSDRKNHPSYKNVDNQLKKLVEKGEKATAISRKLGICRKSVYNKINYLELRKEYDKSSSIGR